MPAQTYANRQDDYEAKRNVTVVGAAVNLVLSFVKVIFGVVWQSQALIADGIHSLSDLLSDAMVLVAAKYNSQAADEEHPYGHARFETAATVGLGIMLLAVAAGIALDAAGRIAEPESLLIPGFGALAVAVISILSNEWLYRYTIRIANRTKSDMLRANAWHHRTDAISSVVVFVGILGTMLGLTYLDAVAAIGVALMITRIGWDLGWGAIRELVDSGLEPARLERIRATIEAVDGVREYHMLRTRRMGAEALVEVHVGVDPWITVSEGHMISDRISERLRVEQPDISEVLVHIDPEDDAVERPTAGLPERATILAQLESSWELPDIAGKIEKVYLHYLEGGIDVEIILPLSEFSDSEHARSVAETLNSKSSSVPTVRNVAIYFH